MSSKLEVIYLPIPERITLPNVRPTAPSMWTEPPEYPERSANSRKNELKRKLERPEKD